MIMQKLEHFVERAIKKHNDKYDYSLVEYVNMRTKIKIICKKHGIFVQVPSTHLSRSGCPSCAGVKRRTKQDFIDDSIKVHGLKYEYEISDYVNNQKKIKIVCKEHGVFEQLPQNHLSGRGCPSCVGVNKITIENFIEKSIVKHGQKYDYSEIKFIRNNDDKVEIICPKHGVFTQRVSSHLEGYGCKSCAMDSKVSKIESNWLDLIGIDEKFRQHRIDKYIVDGYNPDTNTVYEFNGDFWHGNPKKYEQSEINKMLGKTFGDLYKNTIKKEKSLKEKGYKVISIWESDYKESLKKEP